MRNTADAIGDPDQGLESKRLFLKKLLADKHNKKMFRQLCDQGCPEEQIGSLFWAICVMVAYKQVPLAGTGKVSQATLRKIPDQLLEIAEVVELINASPVAPANDVRLAPPDPVRQMKREEMIRHYERLPGLLRLYAHHLKRFVLFSRKLTRRLTMGHLLVLGLVHGVDKRTGSPHYEAISTLLEQGFCIVSASEDPPRYFTESGLTKLYQRNQHLISKPLL